MMTTYKLIKNKDNEVSCVLRIEDNTVIPVSEGNTDYQTYLKWLAAGNTPEPAENT